MWPIETRVGVRQGGGDEAAGMRLRAVPMPSRRGDRDSMDQRLRPSRCRPAATLGPGSAARPSAGCTAKAGRGAARRGSDRSPIGPPRRTMLAGTPRPALRSCVCRWSGTRATTAMFGPDRSPFMTSTSNPAPPLPRAPHVPRCRVAAHCPGQHRRPVCTASTLRIYEKSSWRAPSSPRTLPRPGASADGWTTSPGCLDPLEVAPRDRLAPSRLAARLARPPTLRPPHLRLYLRVAASPRPAAAGAFANSRALDWPRPCRCARCLHAQRRHRSAPRTAAVLDPYTGRDFVSASSWQTFGRRRGNVAFDVELGYPTTQIGPAKS